MQLFALAIIFAAPIVGLDVGRIVDNATLHDNNVEVDSTGTPFIRLNLRLDEWTSPTDTTKRGPDQLTWFEAYDRIVDDYLARGIQVYGLINDEALYSSQVHGSDAWIGEFVQNAVAIVDHFKNRIRVYEIINEPNNWDETMTARFSPYELAKILQDTYLAVKHDGGHKDDACWSGVQLVSGPLLSFDGTTAAEYLDAVYAAGTSQLAWDYTSTVTGSYPLDGIGYHLYVAQGLDSPRSSVRTQTLANLGAVWNVIENREGASTPKQLWISEFGWEAELVGAAEQAARFETGFAAMVEHGHVALATYFVFQDFPGSTWGLFDDAKQPRPGVASMRTLASTYAPVHNARISSIVAPPLETGARGEVIVTLVNRGTTAWGTDVRLAAAPGCPDAAHANAIAWEPASGYANSLVDARVFLPHAVAPGESIELRVPVRAPDAAGNYVFAARLVQENVAMFGPTLHAPITVAAADPNDPPPDDREDDPTMNPAGCGCASGEPTGALLLLGALGLRRRRAR